jgi:hypothetical protein
VTKARDFLIRLIRDDALDCALDALDCALDEIEPGDYVTREPEVTPTTYDPDDVDYLPEVARRTGADIPDPDMIWPHVHPHSAVRTPNTKE